MTPTRVYCTYFDSNYLSRGRAMIESLRAVGDSSTIVVLTLDDNAAKQVESWPALGVEVVPIGTLEGMYPRLKDVKDSRSRMEYVFTLTPWLCHFVQGSHAEAEWVIYLDADLYFFSPVDHLFQDMSRGSVAIVEHRFSPDQRWRMRYGRYNVAWVGFRNDRDGRSCLEWWAESCLDWCFDYPDQGRFADQGYLDGFADQVPSVVVLQHPGVDTAPWNLRTHHITTDGHGRPLSDGEPLVFYHFHGLRRRDRRFYFKHLPYLASTTPTVRDHVYRPYCERLVTLEVDVDENGPTMARRPTVASSLRNGRTTLIQTLSWLRGDYLDV